MSHTKYFKQGQEHLSRALALDNQTGADPEQPLKVYTAYMLAMESFDAARLSAQNQGVRDVIVETMARFMPRIEYLKDLAFQRNLPAGKKKGGGDDGDAASSGSSSRGDAEKNEAMGERERLRGMLEHTICKTPPNVHWDDIVGLESAKQVLHETIVLPQLYPELFTGKRAPWRSILFYGPPGTGKTHLARAVATETQVSFMNLSSADIVSKWVGEGEKIVRAMFELARENAPTVMFIDEIDALCGSGGESEIDATRRIKTEFLTQLQGFHDNPHDGVLLIGATNVPWSFAENMWRRFQKPIYVPLPDEAARRRMIELSLKNIAHTLTASDLDDLARLTQGYSGSDLELMMRDALLYPVRRAVVATHFRPVLVRPPRDGQERKFSFPADPPQEPEIAWQSDCEECDCEDEEEEEEEEQSEPETPPPDFEPPSAPDYSADDERDDSDNIVIGYIPCNPDVQGAVPMTLQDVRQAGRMVDPPCIREDFLQALHLTKPTVTEASIRRFDQWHRHGKPPSP